MAKPLTFKGFIIIFYCYITIKREKMKSINEQKIFKL